jgi:hypothetical protein
MTLTLGRLTFVFVTVTEMVGKDLTQRSTLTRQINVAICTSNTEFGAYSSGSYKICINEIDGFTFKVNNYTECDFC